MRHANWSQLVTQSRKDLFPIIKLFFLFFIVFWGLNNRRILPDSEVGIMLQFANVNLEF